MSCFPNAGYFHRTALAKRVYEHVKDIPAIRYMALSRPLNKSKRLFAAPVYWNDLTRQERYYEILDYDLRKKVAGHPHAFATGVLYVNGVAQADPKGTKAQSLDSQPCLYHYPLLDSVGPAWQIVEPSRIPPWKNTELSPHVLADRSAQVTLPEQIAAIRLLRYKGSKRKDYARSLVKQKPEIVDSLTELLNDMKQYTQPLTTRRTMDFNLRETTTKQLTRL